MLEVAKREEKSTFCARFVYDRGAALVNQHDLSGDIRGGRNEGYLGSLLTGEFGRKLPFSR